MSLEQRKGGSRELEMELCRAGVMVVDVGRRKNSAAACKHTHMRSAPTHRLLRAPFQKPPFLIGNQRGRSWDLAPSGGTTREMPNPDTGMAHAGK